MRKLLFLITSTLVLLSLSSCGSYRNVHYVNLSDSYTLTWKNKTKKEIIEEKGIPNRIVDMGDGEVIVYEKFSVKSETETHAPSHITTVTTTESSNGITTQNTNVFSNGSTSKTTTTNNRTSYTEFYMNKEGKCYKVETSHGYSYKETKNGFKFTGSW